MSIIESLGKGFQVVRRYWWLPLIPILLDTFLWIGPQASVENLMRQTLDALPVEMADAPNEDMSEWVKSLQAAMGEMASRYNGFSALRVGLLGVPSLMSWGEVRLGSASTYETMWIIFSLITDRPDLLVSVPDATFVDVLVLQLTQPWSWLLSSILLAIAGILIGCTYLASITHTLRGLSDSRTFWQRVLRLGSHCVLFWVLRAVVMLIAGVPFVLVFLALSAFSPALSSLFGTIVLGMVTWLSFYGTFLVAAMAMNDASVLQAIWYSFNVVLRNFGSTLGLFLLINLIGGGLTILWQRLSTGSWWTWIGIVGNAYVGTSLVVASLVFYHDRYTRWREALIGALAGQSKRTA
ncbi:MAG: hypothetical protein ISS56_00140 [Anaerolineae bacterium]|nr:hypothetical protein [Anaerolineae bacterium]